MKHDYSKPSSHASSPEETERKRKLPVYILIVVGIFLVALIAYMVADYQPDAADAPPDHPNPNAQPATPNNPTPDSKQS
jgi:flagellar basal body-associated protein FliL